MLIRLTNLFTSFHKNNIDYVVWKSLENIHAALDGQDDLDILFNPQQIDSLLQLLLKHNFIQDKKSLGTLGQDLIVFRGFDKNSGKFIMLHLHFKCRFGSKKRKEFHFPHESTMLKNTKLYQGVKLLSDPFFIITRLLVSTLKYPKPDPYLTQLAAKFFKLKSSDQSLVVKYLTSYFGQDIQLIFTKLAKGDTAILNSLRPQAYRHITHIKKLNTPVLSGFYLTKRFLPRNKISFPLDIMLSGIDGTGKTSVSKHLALALNPISAIKCIYLGRNTWSWLNTRLNHLRQKKLFNFLNYLWPITSTLEIFYRYYMGKFFKKLGRIVIYDRSPCDISLKYSGKNILISWFPRLMLALTPEPQATLCYLLSADPATLLTRKDSHNLDQVKKNKELYSQQYKNQCETIDTTHLSINQISARIINDIFKLATS